MWTDIQVSRERYQHDESKLLFRMSHYFSAMRDCYIKKVKMRFATYCLFTYLASFFCFIVVFSTLTGPVNSEGKMLDMYGTGLACFMSFVILVHSLFF